jgi:bis(5'-nucleosyl)-tetraphosphatase (symmetrical)
MTSLERLLAAIKWRPGTPLWLAGDLVNRGPRSLDVLRWARAHERDVTCVLGNHDLHLIARAAGARPAKKKDTLDDVLAAPDRDALVAWLAARPLVAGDADHILVHAGVLPGWSRADLEQRARHAELLVPELVRGRGDDAARTTLAACAQLRCCTAAGAMVEFDGAPADAPAGARPWWELARPDLPTVVHGHWAAAGLMIDARHIALDTGCVWGRQLTAVRLEDRRVVQVSAAD